MKITRIMKFCKICFYADTHPLGLIINSDGVCSGCTVHSEKFKIDWHSKYKKLFKIINKYKSKKNFYDCVVPVSGGRDSFFIVYQVKKLGLNPLLVYYNSYFSSEISFKNLSNLRTVFDCDILVKNINPIKIKKITRYTLTQFGNIYWPVIAGYTVFPVQVAVNYKIPLIIWGCHQGLEQVGMYSHHNEVEMSKRYRKNHDLFGVDAKDLITNENFLTENDIHEFLYPSDDKINNIGVRGIYLGNYIKWDIKKQSELMIKNFKYKTHRFSRTVDCYDYVDCQNYMNLHDLLKLYKHGYSKVTDHLTREIRYNRVSKSFGYKIIKKFEQNKPYGINVFCKWLGIDKDSLDFILDKHRNPNFWQQIDVDKWIFNGWSKQNNFYGNEKKINEINFISNSKLDKNNDYLTISKGWPI